MGSLSYVGQLVCNWVINVRQQGGGHGMAETDHKVLPPHVIYQIVVVNEV